MKESISVVKEKILDFIKRDIVIKVFAGFLAVILWLIISNSLNPVVTEINDMPKITGYYTIRPGELVVKSSSGTTLKNSTSGNEQNPNANYILQVDFIASGRKNQIKSLTTNDFTVDLDLSEVKRSGESREYKVNVIVKSNVWGVEPKNQSVVSVKLDFEEVTDKVNIPVEVTYKDSEITADNYTVVSAGLSKKTLDVTGFESKVKKIVKARIDLTENDFQQKLTSDTAIKKTYTFYDANNEIVQIEGYNPEPIEISLQIGKKVELKYKVIGTPNTGVYFKESAITPQYVIVVGTSSSILEGLVDLNTTEVSIDGRKSDFSEEVEIISLPSGVSLVEDVKPTVSVKFGGVKEKKFTIGGDKISIKGANWVKYDYIIKSVNPLTVKGNDDDIDGISISSLKPQISVSGYGASEIPIPVKVTVSLSSDISEIESAIAQVIIKEKIIETPTPPTEPTDTSPSDTPTDTTGSPDNTESPSP